jgi:hypothetical protein
MKRDMDLVRAILMEVEKVPFDGGSHQVQVEGRSVAEISYHVMLLHRAGLIDALDLSADEYPLWRPMWLTWDGHEFLDAARDQTRWTKAKDKVMSTTGALAFEALKMVLGALTKQALTGGM